MKEFERYLKALIEAYGTTEGKPLNLDDETVLKIGKKLRSLIANETIEEEIPNDLEEAKEAYCEEHNDDCFDATGDKCPHIRNAFIAGAKWQKEQDQETIKLSEINPFLAGVNYQKEQMMKDAVEGEITKDNRGNNVVRTGVFNNGFEIGDKVRIIIVKED